MGSGRFAPQHIRIGRVSQTACNGYINPATVLRKTFRRALPINEFAVTWIGVGKQEAGGIGIRARDENRGHAAYVRSKTRSDKFLDKFTCRHHNFAAQMSTFLSASTF